MTSAATGAETEADSFRPAKPVPRVTRLSVQLKCWKINVTCLKLPCISVVPLKLFLRLHKFRDV